MGFGLGVAVQLGGGLRTLQNVEAAFDAGASRVVLGTAAYTDVDFLDAAVEEFGDRVLVSIDARDGRLAASGWTEQTDIPVESVIQHDLVGSGVRNNAAHQRLPIPARWYLRPGAGDASTRRYFRVIPSDGPSIVLALHEGPIEFVTLPFVAVAPAPKLNAA